MIRHWRRNLLQLTTILLLFLLAGCQTAATSRPIAPERSTVPESRTTGQLTIWMLDVGQGDCLLLKSPSGKYMLVDGGPGESAAQTLATLDRLGVNALDVLLVSHPHEDHIGGLADILAVMPTQVAYLPGPITTTRAYERLLLGLKQRRAQIVYPRTGDILAWDRVVKVTVIGPVKDYEELNDSSLVLRVEFDQTSFLLTGDITAQAEEDLLRQGVIQPATVLKVAHHGSNGSSRVAFLNQVAPALALISVGQDNDYDHPSLKTLSRLEAASAKILRTDQQGTIRLISDGHKVQVYNEKSLTKENASGQLVGNIKSQVVHLAGTQHLPSTSNRVSFTSLNVARSAGYRPCTRCFPAGKEEIQ